MVHPSPAGRRIAAIRWILLLIEISAVVTKIAFGLRRRRPYDTVVAAIEVIQEGSSVAMAGNNLAELGLGLEQRSAAPRTLRVAAVPDLLRRRAERRHPTPDGEERARTRRRTPLLWRLLGRTDEIADDEQFPPPPATGFGR